MVMNFRLVSGRRFVVLYLLDCFLYMGFIEYPLMCVQR